MVAFLAAAVVSASPSKSMSNLKVAAEMDAKLNGPGLDQNCAFIVMSTDDWHTTVVRASSPDRNDINCVPPAHVQSIFVPSDKGSLAGSKDLQTNGLSVPVFASAQQAQAAAKLTSTTNEAVTVVPMVVCQAGWKFNIGDRSACTEGWSTIPGFNEVVYVLRHKNCEVGGNDPADGECRYIMMDTNDWHTTVVHKSSPDRSDISCVPPAHVQSVYLPTSTPANARKLHTNGLDIPVFDSHDQAWAAANALGDGYYAIPIIVCWYPGKFNIGDRTACDEGWNTIAGFPEKVYTLQSKFCAF
jgi:hypothetical protein